ncbi:NAP-domain-containing protein [Ramicandelaber brevisporus]|nr:NAP-domain-containing protein [Ramicandelaber brevisporus]
MAGPSIDTVALVRSSLNALIGTSSGYMEALPPQVKRRLLALKAIQQQHKDISAEFSKEVHDLEKKYLARFDPLYAKRAGLVNGTAEPSEEDVRAAQELTSEDVAALSLEDAGDDATNPAADVDVKGIPAFWYTALANHPQINDMFGEQDQPALEKLRDIRIKHTDETNQEKPGYVIEFEFDDNEYFENKVLSKTYFFQFDNYSGDLVYSHMQGTDIKWKQGKNLSFAVESRKQRNKSTNQTRIVKKEVPVETFFNYFVTTPPPDDADDSEEAAQMRARIESEYDLGELFKRKIVPRAIDWFTGRALEFEEFDVLDDDDDDYMTDDDDAGDMDDDEDDDDLEESDEDGNATRKTRGSNAADQKPECKQQ